jgi:RNA polymerase sigma factor (sigma-70 family)
MEAVNTKAISIDISRDRDAEGRHYPDDLALARRAATNCETAWHQIYEMTRERLFTILMYHVGNREEALELLQETYLAALKSLHRYRGSGPLIAWFAVIAIRRAFDWKRSLYRLRRKTKAFADATETNRSPQIDPFWRRELHQALSRLSKRQRAAFLLRELAGNTFNEIGAILGISAATARVHHFRARQSLQNILTQEEIES